MCDKCESEWYKTNPRMSGPAETLDVVRAKFEAEALWRCRCAVIKANEPVEEMLGIRMTRYASMGVHQKDLEFLSRHRPACDLFDALLKAEVPLSLAMAWVMSDCHGPLNERHKTIESCRIASSDVADLLKMVSSRSINRNAAIEVVFPIMLDTGAKPADIVREKKLAMISGDTLAVAVDNVMASEEGVRLIGLPFGQEGRGQRHHGQMY